MGNGKFIVEVGAGGCRGKNWNQPPFPINQGRLSKENCVKVCIKNDCTCFHMLYPEEDGTAECFLFGHKEVFPVRGLGGMCYSLSDKAPSVSGLYDEDDDEEDQEIDGPVHMAVLGKGRCRGPGWTFKKWPVLKGMISPQDCADSCAKKRGCTAFDLSDKQADNTYDCALYGHAKVSPASGVPGTCYVLSDKPGVLPNDFGLAAEEEKEDVGDLAGHSRNGQYSRASSLQDNVQKHVQRKKVALHLTSVIYSQITPLIVHSMGIRKCHLHQGFQGTVTFCQKRKVSYLED